MSAMPPNADSRASHTRQPDMHFPRRNFLTLVGKSLLVVSGLLGLGGLVEYLSYQPEPSPPTQYDLGPASSYPPGSNTLIAQVPAVLLHTGAEFKALSLVCPHLGCTVEPTGKGYACPCHGSRFNEDGSIRNGPANKPMQALKVEETPDGRLILHTSG
jgi:cytochrome b6-f complex iron-sulfur subunit